MNKARMTFRFDRQGQAQTNSRTVSPPTIPESAHPADEWEQRPDERLRVRAPEIVSPPAVRPEADKTLPADPKTLDAMHKQDIKRMDSSPINAYNTDFGAWNSPFEAEVQKLEQLIRNSHPDGRRPPLPEPVYNPETGYYESGHAVPVIEPERSGPRKPGPVRPPRTILGRLAASLAGALVTGTLFGWFVLSMFSASDEQLPTGSMPFSGLSGTAPPTAMQPTWDDPLTMTDDQLPFPIHLLQHPADQRAMAEGDTPLSEGTGDDASKPVPLPASSFVILQHGAFSSEKAAREAQSGLKELGIMGVGELDGNYYVYAGIAADRDEAIVLKHRLDEAHVETYMKEYTLPAMASFRWDGANREAPASYLNKGNELVRMISRLTVSQWERERRAPFEANTMTALRSLHQEWSDAAASFTAGLQEKEANIVSRMENAMNTAVVALESFQKNTADSLLWQAQAGIAQYLLLERGLRASLADDMADGS